MTKPLNASCEMCAYGVFAPKSSNGVQMVECHRFPPQGQEFPLTAPGDWCAEFAEEK